jgi:GAF domain-containing protein
MKLKINTLTRLVLLSGALVAGVFLFGVYVISSIYSIRQYNQLSYHIDQSQQFLNKAWIAKEEFLGTSYSDTVFVIQGVNNSLIIFNSSMDSLSQLTAEIQANDIIRFRGQDRMMSSIETDAKLFRDKFLQAVGLVNQKGFKNIGLEGQMRLAIHSIENAKLPIDKVYLLTLRRHEKDFLLRKDPQYVRRFDTEIEVFRSHLQDLNTPDTTLKAEVIAALETYQTVFKEIVNIETTIGLHPNTGLRGEMARVYNGIERQLNNFNLRMKESNQRATTIILGSLSGMFLIFILTAIISLRWLLLYVAKPVSQIRDAAIGIADGDISINLSTLKTSRLLRALTMSFDKIVLKFRTVMEQIEQISTRKITQELPLNNEKDEVTHTLNKIIVELRRIDTQEAKRKWFNEGLAQFADLLRVNSSGEVNLYDNVVRNFVKILHANLGALFVVEAQETGEEILEMRSCYAYNRKKFLERQILKGEGIAGTAWVEQEYIYLTDLPEDYLSIGSGIGESLPKCLLVVPLKVNEQVMGVLELASFTLFEEHEIQLVLAVSENVASFIQNAKISEKTRSLLEGSNILTQQLREQEEELRQNMEEMLATQEEMRRNELELNDKVKRLLEENLQLKQRLNNYSGSSTDRWQNKRPGDN